MLAILRLPSSNPFQQDRDMCLAIQRLEYQDFGRRMVAKWLASKKRLELCRYGLRRKRSRPPKDGSPIEEGGDPKADGDEDDPPNATKHRRHDAYLQAISISCKPEQRGNLLLDHANGAILLCTTSQTIVCVRLAGAHIARSESSALHIKL